MELIQGSVPLPVPARRREEEERRESDVGKRGGGGGALPLGAQFTLPQKTRRLIYQKRCND